MEKSEYHKAFMKEKFGRITRYYDLVNAICSFGQDKGWRKELAKALASAEEPLLDLCCGPFTLTLEILKLKPTQAFALDLSGDMLRYGLTKNSPLLSYILPLRGDAEELPFRSGSFGGLSIAFGFRNLVDKMRALQEMHRVLKKGGLLAILEFSKPRLPLLRQAYFFYLQRLIPLIGRALTGEAQAYRYLARSIAEFPETDRVRRMLAEASFSEVSTKALTLGVVTLYLWKKV